MKRFGLMLALAALLMVPSSLAAQDDAPMYIWVNYMNAAPGQGEELSKVTIEEDSKTFNPLVDGDAALDWGLAMPVIHDGNDPASHVEWISFAGWAGVDAFMAKFMESRQAMSDEERAALMAKFEAVVEDGSHSDDVYEVVVTGQATGRPGYINLGYYTAKPGKSGDAKEFYKEIAMPVYEELQAAGTITSYGLAVPAVHRGENYTHMGWFSTPNLAARDTVFAAFDAAEAARSEEENKAIGERWQETFDSEGHMDQILMVIHHYAGPQEGE